MSPLLLLAAALGPQAAAADWTVGGHVQTDVRYYVQTTDVGTWYNPLGLDAGFVQGFVYCIYQAKDGDIWFGSAGAGVRRYDGERFRD